MNVNVSPKFGVEIEFLGTVDRDLVVQALCAAGLPAVSEGYNHHVREHWKLTTDSSCGLELVTPPLAWHERMQVRRAMQVLTSCGAEVNKDCGMHVHHEWPWRDIGLTDEDKRTRLTHLRAVYNGCEPLLRVLLSDSRWDNPMCKRDPNPDRSDRPRAAMWCEDCGTDTYHCRECRTCNRCNLDACSCGPEDLFTDRYVAVNFVCQARQPTVEFRQHQGTLNGAKALAWIELTRNITHAASRPEVDDHKAFIFDKLSLSTLRYMESRATEKGHVLSDLIEQCT